MVFKLIIKLVVVTTTTLLYKKNDRNTDVGTYIIQYAFRAVEHHLLFYDCINCASFCALIGSFTKTVQKQNCRIPIGI